MLHSLDEDLKKRDLNGKLRIIDCIKTELQMAEQTVWALLTDTLRNQIKVCFDFEFTSNLLKSYIKFKNLQDLTTMLEQNFDDTVIHLAHIHLSQYDTYQLPASITAEQIYLLQSNDTCKKA